MPEESLASQNVKFAKQFLMTNAPVKSETSSPFINLRRLELKRSDPVNPGRTMAYALLYYSDQPKVLLELVDFLSGLNDDDITPVGYLPWAVVGQIARTSSFVYTYYTTTEPVKMTSAMADFMVQSYICMAAALAVKHVEVFKRLKMVMPKSIDIPALFDEFKRTKPSFEPRPLSFIEHVEGVPVMISSENFIFLRMDGSIVRIGDSIPMFDGPPRTKNVNNIYFTVCYDLDDLFDDDGKRLEATIGEQVFAVAARGKPKPSSSTTPPQDSKTPAATPAIVSDQLLETDIKKFMLYLGLSDKLQVVDYLDKTYPGMTPGGAAQRFNADVSSIGHNFGNSKVNQEKLQAMKAAVKPVTISGS